MSSDWVNLGQSVVIGLILAIALTAIWRPPKADPAPEGCRYCGGSVARSLGHSACTACQARERLHLQRMAALTEKEARLRSDLLLAQITAQRDHNTTAREGQGTT